MIVCHLRYRLDLEKLDAFRQYAEIWVSLIERHGGEHLGYYVATDIPEPKGFSFPGLGRSGDPEAAFALFRFPDRETYDAYRRDVRSDPDCGRADRLLRESGCFLDYERTFVTRIA